MPRAETTPTTSRRAMFAVAGAAVLAVPAAGKVLHAATPSAPHPDAELLHLAAEFVDLERRHAEQPDCDTYEEDEVRLIEAEGFMQRQHEISDAFLNLPARTLAGHQAVARCLAAWCDPGDYGRGRDMAERLIGALLHGLVGRVPQEKPPAPVFVPTPAAARVEPLPNPDAGLIALCAEHIRNLEAYSSADADCDADLLPYKLAYNRAHDAVRDAKPVSLFGIMAKARAEGGSAGSGRVRELGKLLGRHLGGGRGERPSARRGDGVVSRGHSRRALLGSSAAALLLVAPAAGEAKAAELDGELIRLCEEYVEADKEFCRLGEESATWTSAHPGYAENNRRSHALVDRLHDLEDRIADFRPRTPEGLRAMALAALRSMSGNLDTDPSPMRWEDNVAWAVCAVVAGRLDA